MRHRKKGRKLNRTASHRKALLSNLAASLFEHKQITTTTAKAKEARSLAERLITFAKRGDVSARREVLKYIPKKRIVNILFHEIAPKYRDRAGGYTRIVKLGERHGDSAPVSLLELVDFQKAAKETKEKKKSKKAEKSAKKE
ncbi:MAG: 50S ribosomal protein L17 [Fidelibacterota bacterium]